MSGGRERLPGRCPLLRAHLKEALTTRPLMGCGGRQFPTRGTGGSFSALDRRLRSLAICEGKEDGQPHRAPRARRSHWRPSLWLSPGRAGGRPCLPCSVQGYRVAGWPDRPFLPWRNA